jgi:hypothetical protein
MLGRNKPASGGQARRRVGLPAFGGQKTNCGVISTSDVAIVATSDVEN